MPSVQEFADRMQYSSTSSAHFVLEQLFEQGHIAKTETGRLRPGELFLRASDRTAVPAELLDALPTEKGMRAMRVEAYWLTDESMQPGDILVLAPPERDELSDSFVLSRGDTYAVTPRMRPGWKTHGVVLGLYRSHVKTD